MSHALKIEDFPQLKTTDANAISDVLKAVASELDLTSRLSEISCRGYDGFIPYSWNKGGWESCGYTTIDMIIGSGIGSGSSSFNDLVEKYYNDEIDSCFKKYCEDNNLKKTYEDLTEDEIELYHEYESEWFQCDSDYHSVQVEYKGIYLGVENGIHTISLNVFLCASDAPYHRRSDDYLEIEISFRDINSKNFQNKLKKAVEKLSDFIGYLELY